MRLICFSRLFMLACLSMATACSDRSMRNYPTIQASPLVVISHTASGELVDYLAVKDLSGIEMIQVLPRDGSSDVHATALGSMRHPMLQKDWAISSTIAEGQIGKVLFRVQDGMAMNMEGNTISMPSPVTEKTLAKVEQMLAAGHPNLSGAASIQVIRTSE